MDLSVEDAEKFRGWVARKQWLFHTPTLSVGPASAFFDGATTFAISSVNNEPVQGPVLALLSGQTLVANVDSFIELEKEYVSFYLESVEYLREFMLTLTRRARVIGIQEQTALTLLVSTLRSQLQALQGSGEGS